MNQSSKGLFTVLCIEDDEMNMLVLDRMLSTQTFNILKAENAEWGVQLARQHRPDLILMDITLSGMNGFEALQILRSDPPTEKIPVVAVTASTVYEQKTFLEAGFADLILKPIRMSKLVSVLRRYAIWNETEARQLKPN